MRHVLIAALLGLCFTTTAFAANVDVSVDLSGPAQGMVGSPLSYNLALRNTANQAAQNVVATVSLSGAASIASVTAPCVVQSGQVRCTYSSLPGGSLRNLTVTLAAPTSASTLTLTANVTTSSRDSSSGNNRDTQTTQVAAAAAPIVGQQDLHIVQCSGSGPLVFANCTPGSLQIADFLLLPDHTVEVFDPAYSGVFSQGTSSQLQMVFTDVTVGLVEAVYDGQAVSSTCFEGTMTYPQNPSWHGAFRACLVP